MREARISDPQNVNFHTLRHTAASLWIRDGVDVATVSRRLGHQKSSFTIDTYAHLFEGQQLHAATALDRVLA